MRMATGIPWLLRDRFGLFAVMLSAIAWQSVPVGQVASIDDVAVAPSCRSPRLMRGIPFMP